MRFVLMSLFIAACAVEQEPVVSVVTSGICQDGHDCTHLPPTCAQLGCPYAPSGTSYTWTPCPESVALCWCWGTDGEARQCAHFTD